MTLWPIRTVTPVRAFRSSKPRGRTASSSSKAIRATVPARRTGDGCVRRGVAARRRRRGDAAAAVAIWDCVAAAAATTTTYQAPNRPAERQAESHLGVASCRVHVQLVASDPKPRISARETEITTSFSTTRPRAQAPVRTIASVEELLELELAGWTALCDGTASEFYGSVMAEHGVMVLAHGEVMDRASVVEALRETRSWVSYEIDDTRFVDLGADAAALLYTEPDTVPTVLRSWR